MSPQATTGTTGVSHSDAGGVAEGAVAALERGSAPLVCDASGVVRLTMAEPVVAYGDTPATLCDASGVKRAARRLALLALFLIAACGGSAPRNEKLMEIPEFQLVDDRGATFRSASLRGEPALLFFGYTHCPDACPMMLSVVARAYREAGADARRIPTLFVSVDPRDTPPELAKYLSYFSAVPARGLTGSTEQIDEVVKHFGAKYEIRETGSAAGPAVDHTLRLYLLDRDGDVAALFDPSASPAEIAKAMKAL